jgi:RimJ/RimL family protein N-acetyltransferase
MKQTLYALVQSLRNRRFLLIALLIALIPASYGAYRLVVDIYETYTPLETQPEEIKGKLVTLRTLKEEYFVDYHNAFSTMVRKGLDFPEFITLGYTIQYLQDMLINAKAGKTFLYCIFENQSNKLIGDIEVREKKEGDPGQFGWWINEAYWGKGYAQEALALITKAYFRYKPTENSFIAHVRIWNKRSYYGLKKGGFQDVGYFYEDGKATRYILEMKRR